MSNWQLFIPKKLFSSTVCFHIENYYVTVEDCSILVLFLYFLHKLDYMYFHIMYIVCVWL